MNSLDSKFMVHILFFVPQSLNTSLSRQNKSSRQDGRGELVTKKEKQRNSGTSIGHQENDHENGRQVVTAGGE